MTAEPVGTSPESANAERRQCRGRQCRGRGRQAAAPTVPGTSAPAKAAAEAPAEARSRHLPRRPSEHSVVPGMDGEPPAR